MSTKIATAATYLALLSALDGFLTGTGHAWGLAYTGTGDGRLTGAIGTSSSVVETVTATATSATSFTVTGSVSGSLGTATVGSAFTSGKCAFTIAAGSAAFVAGDKFTFNLSPKWTRLRLGGCPEANYRTASFTNVAYLFDGATTSGANAISTTTFPATITVQMGVATEVRAFSMWSGSSTAQAPKDFALQYSDDGSSWTTAQSWTSQTWSAAYTRKDFVLSSSAGSHLYWRINITAANSATLSFVEARLFNDAAMKWDVSSRLEFAWSAPGVANDQTIYVAGYTDTDNGTDRYNLVFRGFRYWPDLATSVLDVPNHAGDKSLLLSKNTTAYWFIAHGSRVIVVARTSSVYQFAYIGMGLPYETPSVHAFPFMVGAPYPGTGVRWDLSTDAAYRNPSDPGSLAQTSGANASLAVMMPDGNFLQVANRCSFSSTLEGVADISSSGRGRVWPYAQADTAAVQADHLRDCMDGSKPLLPLVLFRPTAPVHTWGEFDGVYWTTGYSNSAEATIRDGAIDCLVVPNVNRSSIQSFAAIALD